MRLSQHTILFVLAVTAFACSKEELPPDSRTNAQSGAAATETPTAPSISENANESIASVPSVHAPIDASSPVGSWTLDANASFEANMETLLAGAKELTPEQEKSMRSAVAMVVDMRRMDLQLGADHSLSGTNTAATTGGGAATPTALTGTWSVDGEVLSVSMRAVGAVEFESSTGRLEGAQLVLLMQQGEAPPLTLIFVRKS